MEANYEENSIAHIISNDHGQFDIQSLKDHLEGTAILASKFSSEFDSQDWGRLSGLLHDLGKYSPDFQKYIRSVSGYEREVEPFEKTDHSTAGAIFASELFKQSWPPLAYCISGHHTGLLNYFPENGISGDLQSRLSKRNLLENIIGYIPKEIYTKYNLSRPFEGNIDTEHIHLWIRMLYSCLVDADYLDTERFMKPEVYLSRGHYEEIKDLNDRLDNYLDEIIKNASDNIVNGVRREILNQCILSSSSSPGFFSLTVPTGGGKTLSTIAWALKHAIKYNKRRVIVAIPYTSIISQTAQIYRDIFGERNVIEHHSNIDLNSNSLQSKLATENWDAPIIITTNVQFFESLFANKPSKCRKLHNIANSIIIFDEAQMLPPESLKPILATLRALVKHYKTSILFSSATQPALIGPIGSGMQKFEGICSKDVKEIIPNIEEIAIKLKRVTIEMPDRTSKPLSWSEIAGSLNQYKRVLCIVNSRKDCRTLFRLMPHGTLHLSRLMCTAHILDTIARIKNTDEKENLRVISTQLIEAGVDIDFPIVYRAMAGLDSIAQSAGRCNREGKLIKEGKLGITKVFYTPDNSLPHGFIRKGFDALLEILHNYPESDFLSPYVFERYFKLLYDKVVTFDNANIEGLLVRDAYQMKFQFATASRDFKLIDDQNSKTIIVQYKDGADYISMLRKIGPEPWIMRKLQRYAVSVYDHDFKNIYKSGMIEEIHGCFIQSHESLYSHNEGLLFNDEWLEEIHII